MSAVALVLMLASTAMQYSAQRKQGKAQKRQAEAAARQARAQAAYNRYNAKIAEQEALAEQQATLQDLKQHRRTSKQKMSRLRAAVGKSGVMMEGSPLLVAEDTASQLALEHAWIGLGGERRISRFRSEGLLHLKKAAMSELQATNYLSAGRDFARAGRMRAGASLLGGGAQAAYMGSTTTTTTKQPLYRTH